MGEHDKKTLSEATTILRYINLSIRAGNIAGALSDLNTLADRLYAESDPCRFSSTGKHRWGKEYIAGGENWRTCQNRGCNQSQQEIHEWE